MSNPNSQFKGMGRVLQLTGTAKKAKKFVDSGHSHIDEVNISPLQKDILIINGMKKQVNLIQDTQKGYKIKTKNYYKAVKEVKEFLKRSDKLNLKSNINDKTYSAWTLFNKVCDDNY